MSELKVAKSGEGEADFRQFLAYLFAQQSVGIAVDGVLAGLVVAQTTTASSSVTVDPGMAVAQDTRLAGAFPMVNNTVRTLDVLGPNPVGGLPRNDVVVFDAATESIRAIVGTPNASPTDPSVPATAVPLARLRHAASATTVPTAKIDDLRVKTSLAGAASEADVINGVPFAGASAAKAAKRLHWGVATFTTSGPGLATVTHGAGFTPTSVLVTASDKTWRIMVDNFTSTTFRVKTFDGSGNLYNLSGVEINYLCGE